VFGLSARPSVGLSVGNDREFLKNGRLDRDEVWGGGSSGPKKPRKGKGTRFNNSIGL